MVHQTEESTMATADENVATVRAAYESFARQDIPAVLAAFDSNIEWYTPEELPGGGTAHGHDGVMKFFQGLQTYYDELHVEPDSFRGSGDQVFAVGHHRGRVNGHPFDIGFCMVWTFRDGKAIRFREYNDSGKLLKIAEGVPVTA
jgi:ketosteroid isomerase-like protein